MSYSGNASCSGSNCHSGEAKEQSGQWIGDEASIWIDWDPHRKGYATLGNAKSKAIAGKLGIADATADSKCLSCHAMDVKAAFQGKRFDVTKGVGCESCHGPAGGWPGDDGRKGWLDPHKDAGWTAEQRKKPEGAKGLRDNLGLIDTSHLPTRAERCVTCHLRIDKDMIEADHPPLEFELNAYSNYLYPWRDDYAIHWDDTRRGDPMIAARLWAVGQAVAKEAGVDDDGLAAVYARGPEIASKHFGAADAEGLANAKLTSKKCLDAATDLAAAGTMARNQMECDIIGYGVGALATAAVYGRIAEAKLPDDVLVLPIKLAPSVDAAAAEYEKKRDAFVAALKALVKAATPE